MYPSLTGDMDRLEGLQATCTGDMLRAPGFKQFFDGVSSAHTAWLAEPYANPRFPGDHGRPTVEPGRMRELVLSAAERGHSVRVHTIGDEAVHEAIAIFAEARDRFGAPRQGRNSLEHVEDILVGDDRALADAGLVASVQPQHVLIDVTQPDRDLGPERAATMWPFASFLAEGVPMAFGSDAPCAAPRAREVLSCAVTREDPATGEPTGGWHPEERIGMADAIRAYTQGSAVVVGREDELGRIAPGYLADLAVLDQDLLDADVASRHDLSGVATLATYVGGRVAWEA
jgi:predicted amidohydrolase YtcJ